jgi:hypothetical protein
LFFQYLVVGCFSLFNLLVERSHDIWADSFTDSAKFFPVCLYIDILRDSQKKRSQKASDILASVLVQTTDTFKYFPADVSHS